MKIQQKIEKWDNGKLKARIRYYKNQGGDKLYHGLVEKWYENGQKENEEFWQKGKRHGTFICWRKDSTVRAIGNFKNGKAIGTFKGWNRNCQLEYEKQIENDFLINGIFYSPSGEIISRVINGNGKEVAFHDNGKLAAEIVWSNGWPKSEGWYYDNNQMASEEKLDLKGNLMSGIYFNPNGKKISEVVNGNGKAILSRLILEKKEFINTWYETDYLVAEYRNGKRISEWRDYNNF